MSNPAIDGMVELGASEAGLVQGGAVAPLIAVLLVPLAAAASLGASYVAHPRAGERR